MAFNNPDTTFEQYLRACRGISRFSWYDGKHNVDISDPEFSGYVVPNGTTFTCASNEFQDACRAFAGNASATSFTVPDLDSYFVKMCRDASQAQLDPVKGHTGLAAHKHTVVPKYTDG